MRSSAAIVEVDETFIGGNALNMHAAKRRAKIHGTGGTDKEIVFGMVERGGKVRAAHVESRGRKNFRTKSASATNFTPAPDLMPTTLRATPAAGAALGAVLKVKAPAAAGKR